MRRYFLPCLFITIQPSDAKVYSDDNIIERWLFTKVVPEELSMKTLSIFSGLLSHAQPYGILLPETSLESIDDVSPFASLIAQIPQAVSSCNYRCMTLLRSRLSRLLAKFSRNFKKKGAGL